MKTSSNRMFLAALLLASAAPLLPIAAHAQDAPAATGDGWYAAGAVTLSLLNDTAGTIANAPMPGSTVRLKNPIETGFGGQVALGHRFGSFRLEGEIGFTHNTQDRYVAIVPPTGSIPAKVSDDALRGMVNGYYDLSYGPVMPFVGAGLGFASVDIDFFAPRAPFPAEAPRQLIKDGDTLFAYQLMAGVAVPVSEDVALTLQYRWFDAGTVEALDVRGERIARDHAGHNVDFGIRINF